MGLVKAFSGALTGTLADQWKEIITAGRFDEHTVVVPGVLQVSNNGRGVNLNGSYGVVSNGSKIYVPENTAAIIFNDSGIEDVITEPGGFEYRKGAASILQGDGFKKALLDEVKTRFKFGGTPAKQTSILFVNLREIRGLKFGTPGPVIYNDSYYGTDLEITAFGSFSIKILNPLLFVQNFLPSNVLKYSLDDPAARNQIQEEFIQSFVDALNTLSSTYRVSQLPGQTKEIASALMSEETGVGSWQERFGFKLMSVAIGNVELTEDSRALIKSYSENKMNMGAYADVSEKTGNIVAQQKIAEGIRDNGFGDGAGMLFGMNFAQGLGSNANQQMNQMSFEEQISAVKQLKDLLDAGILTQDEFDRKKTQIMGL
ncbi:SPFH domain-containing protein [Weissella confusa]|uniref:SPFH domain-containing protein n=1 Tax=Weissella confusa TaxID=1583 RepID=UPI0021BFB8D3|nr:SPFH domain-containing protein [Weissella confusa]MCT8393607.1 SPFH domain-containing protein [Weissella confusa]